MKGKIITHAKFVIDNNKGVDTARKFLESSIREGKSSCIHSKMDHRVGVTCRIVYNAEENTCVIGYEPNIDLNYPYNKRTVKMADFIKLKKSDKVSISTYIEIVFNTWEDYLKNKDLRSRKEGHIPYHIYECVRKAYDNEVDGEIYSSPDKTSMLTYSLSEGVFNITYKKDNEVVTETIRKVIHVEQPKAITKLILKLQEKDCIYSY